MRIQSDKSNPGRDDKQGSKPKNSAPDQELPASKRKAVCAAIAVIKGLGSKPGPRKLLYQRTAKNLEKRKKHHRIWVGPFKPNPSGGKGTRAWTSPDAWYFPPSGGPKRPVEDPEPCNHVTLNGDTFDPPDPAGDQPYDCGSNALAMVLYHEMLHSLAFSFPWLAEFPDTKDGYYAFICAGLKLDKLMFELSDQMAADLPANDAGVKKMLAISKGAQENTESLRKKLNCAARGF